jgi:hypothetical protein
LVGLLLTSQQVTAGRGGGDVERFLPTMLGSPASTLARRLLGLLTTLAVTAALRHVPSVKYEPAEDASSVGSDQR